MCFKNTWTLFTSKSITLSWLFLIICAYNIFYYLVMTPMAQFDKSKLDSLVEAMWAQYEQFQIEANIVSR